MENPVETESVLEWLEARTGHTVPSLNGKALQSVYDPEKEAVRQIEALRQRLESLDGVQEVLIIGSGGIAFYNALAQSRLPALYRVVIFEPHSAILASIVPSGEESSEGDAGGSRSGSDSSGIARSPASRSGEILLLASRKEAAAFAEKPDCYVYGHPGSLRAHSAYVQELSFLEGLRQKRQINSNTLSRFGSQWVRNLYANVTTVIQAKSINSIKNAFPDHAAVVLGAGPSLADHMESIAAFQRSQPGTLIIAVDTALSTCRIHGVEPNFVVTVDAQPINYYHLADSSAPQSEQNTGIPRTEEPRKNSVLMLDPAASPLAARRWRGPAIVTGNPLPLAVDLNELCGKGELDQLSYGGSVSTNAYDLALYLGCKAVLLVGQDLSFTRSRVHAKGSALEELWSFRESRLQSRETGNYRQRFAIPVVSLMGEDGQTVHSNAKLEVFYHWFQSRLKSDTKKLSVAILESQGARFPSIPLFQTMEAWYEQLPPGLKNKKVSISRASDNADSGSDSSSNSESASGADFNAHANADSGCDADSIADPKSNGGSEADSNTDPNFDASSGADSIVDPTSDSRPKSGPGSRHRFDPLNTAVTPPHSPSNERPMTANVLLVRVEALQEEFRGLRQLLKGPDFERRWTEYSRAIRLAGTGMQGAIEKLETSGQLSPSFKEQLAHQVMLHLTQLGKLRYRLTGLQYRS